MRSRRASGARCEISLSFRAEGQGPESRIAKIPAEGPSSCLGTEYWYRVLVLSTGTEYWYRVLVPSTGTEYARAGAPRPSRRCPRVRDSTCTRVPCTGTSYGLSGAQPAVRHVARERGEAARLTPTRERIHRLRRTEYEYRVHRYRYGLESRVPLGHPRCSGSCVLGTGTHPRTSTSYLVEGALPPTPSVS